MRSATTLLLVSGLALGHTALDPQHWGMGFGYLLVLEERADGTRELLVHAPPLHVKDGPWLLRWRDASDTWRGVLPNGLAAGNFWPRPMGTEHLVALRRGDDDACEITTLATPEAFSTRPWPVLGRGVLKDVKASEVVAACAWHRHEHFDWLLVLRRAGAQGNEIEALVFTPPVAPDGTEWRAGSRQRLGAVFPPGARVVGACVWSREPARDATLAVASSDGQLVFLDLATSDLGKSPPVPWAREPLDRPLSFFAGCDFVKDGFPYLACGDGGTAVRLRAPPRAKGHELDALWVRRDETFAGAKLAAQPPGQGTWLMTATRPGARGRPVAAAAGRIFGYVKPSCDERKATLWKDWTFQGRDDAELSFAERVPLHRLGVPKEWQDGDWPWEPDQHFGWPLKGERVTYRVHVKNNGKAPIPKGRIRLQAWVDVPQRDADLLGAPPTTTVAIDQELPPFDPAHPAYHVAELSFAWPYDLVQPPGWTWKKLDVRALGERWLIVRLQYPGDQNERNDRLEVALNALLLRPELRHDREIDTLTFRAPTITGDPESKEYILRKLADAVQCMWERSRTSTGDDVLQRVAFQGYRLGLPVTRADDWSWFEGCRELDQWIGLWGDFERFDPRDGGAELHETGHLFHRLGDLYHYFVFPSRTRAIQLADGTPVQLYTYAWGRDSFCDGQAILGEGAADLHRYLEGVRYGLGFPWHKVTPEKVLVRVLDRSGKPVPGAKVTLWSYPAAQAALRGATGADGRCDLGFPSGKRTVFAPFGLPLHDGALYDATAHVVTIDLPGYCDAAVWGSEDQSAHSRYTLLQKAITSRAEWTWEFPTLFAADAPRPACRVAVGVRAREVAIQVTGAAGQACRLYRRWEPTWAFERLGEQPLVAGRAHFTDDLSAQDWFTKGRSRATYYVTELRDGTESLPVRVQGIALDRVQGVSAQDGRLLVAANCGRAEPFVVRCDGTTPREEFLRHFRFGHTAAKVVGSGQNPQRFYATLLDADLHAPWSAPRQFDQIQLDRPDRLEPAHHVLRILAQVRARRWSTAAPFTVELEAADPEQSTVPQVGDHVVHPAREGDRARILAIDGLKLTLDHAVFDAGERERWLRIEQVAGADGTGTTTRELQKPRGLCLLTVAGQELVAIADTGNGRVVVWDAATRFLAAWQEPGLRPAALATDPRHPERCFVLDRRADRKSRVRALRWDGSRLRADGPGWAVDVGDGSDPNGPELGLAATTAGDDALLAVTDAARARVLGVRLRGSALTVESEWTAAVGTFAGEAKLTRPTDVAFVGEQLFASDGHQRVVQLRE